MNEKTIDRVENRIDTAEIAHHRMQQYFKKSSAADVSKCVCMWEIVNSLPKIPF